VPTAGIFVVHTQKGEKKNVNVVTESLLTKIFAEKNAFLKSQCRLLLLLLDKLLLQ
jgi:hypothetical protein